MESNKITDEMKKAMEEKVVINEAALDQVFGNSMKEVKRKNSIALHYKTIALTTLVYAVFYTFCLYKNLTGITFPLFIIGSYCYLIFCMKRMEIPVKKDAVTIFEFVCSILLGISTFCTDSTPIQVFNFIGFLLLLGSFMLHQFYDDSQWGFSKYLGALAFTALCTIGHLFDPFVDFNAYREQKKVPKTKEEPERPHKGKYVFYGILVLIPLLAVVVALLSSADLVFHDMLSHLYIEIVVPEHIWGIIFLTLFAFFAAYCFLAAVVNRHVEEGVRNKRVGEPILAITVTSVMAVIYFLFSMIQIVYLFGGGLTLPEGYTYAQYARQGFFELLFVCLINLAMVLVCLTCFREHGILKIILTIISGCTFIMIASSAYRMLLYISAYKLTFLRVLVLWSLLLLTILLAGVFVSIYKERFPLFIYCMLAVTLMYLGLSFSHQDYWIAKYNVSVPAAGDTEDIYDLDWWYLHNLSSDAAPVLVNLDPSYEGFYNDDQMGYHTRLKKEIRADYEKMNFRTFNLSKWIAYQSIKTDKK